MMSKRFYALTLLLASFAVAACGPVDVTDTGENDANQASGPVSAQQPQAQANGVQGRPDTWADCERFAGVVTPANFDPASDPFDELYTGGSGFKNGVPLISESKPGDQDYNGGRWHVNVLKSSVAADKYANACTVEDLDLNDFESTNNYFECPLLPRRGRGHSDASS